MTYCIQIDANLVAAAAVCTRLLEREQTLRKTLHRTPLYYGTCGRHFGPAEN
jgi:hypothetical protein